MGGPPATKRFGPYEIVGRLGFGGMGIVLDARGEDGKPVALKLLRPTGDAAKHKVFAARFNREAKILKKLSHPGVVRLLDSGTIHGIFYLAMERIEGKSLGVLLKRAPLDAEAILALGIKLGETLAHLHEIGIVHRDIKPDNVIIDAQGRPILTDFGLARLSGGTAITRANELVGSLGYIAPEVIEGSVPSPLSDQYALGRMLFNLAAKRKNESNEGLPLLEALQRSMKLDWSSFPNEGAFVRLAEVINRMVARDPAQRFPDMYSLIVELDTLARAFVEAEQGGSIDVVPTDKHAVASAAGAEKPRVPKPRALTQSAPPEAEVLAVGRNWEDDTRWDPDAEKKLLAVAAQLGQPATAPWLASDLSAPAGLQRELEWIRPASERDFVGLSGAIAIGSTDVLEEVDDPTSDIGDTMDMMIKLRRRRALPYSVIEAPPANTDFESAADKSDRVARLKKRTQQFWSEKLQIVDTNPPEPPPEPPPDVLERWRHVVDDLGTFAAEVATLKMPPAKTSETPLLIESPVEAVDPAPEPETFRPLIPYPHAAPARPVPIAPSVLMEEQIATLPPDDKKKPMTALIFTPAKPPRRYGVLFAAVLGGAVAATLLTLSLSGDSSGSAPRYEGKAPPNEAQKGLAVELHLEAEKALRAGDLDKAKSLFGLCIRTADLNECKEALDNMSTGLTRGPR